MDLNKFFRNNYYKSDFKYFVCRCIYELWLTKNYRFKSQEQKIKFKYSRAFGKEPNLTDPKTMNEKIQWLKLNDFQDFYTICADKYAVRQWLAERYGEKYLIPLYFHTDNWREINENNITSTPCIVKANHTSKDYFIIRDAKNVNWKELQRRCRFWLKRNYYLETQERQYKDIHRQIVVEKLLQNSQGKLPNDYKLHFFNGELYIVYVSVDREGINKRNLYDANWNPLQFAWNGSGTSMEESRGPEIAPPPTFELMKEIGAEIAKLFKYVRVDFYDCDGTLYFGEITLHHGGGFDKFIPAGYDRMYGNLLNIR